MILETWKQFSRLPGGRFLFSRFIGRYIPYTGSIRADVLELSQGLARVGLKDRKSVRNHLDSIHAVALMNLSELTTGLAVTSALPKDYRAILKSFSIEYLKKARGTLKSEARFALKPDVSDKEDCEVQVEVRNEEDVVVCIARDIWRVGPSKVKS